MYSDAEQEPSERGLAETRARLPGQKQRNYSPLVVLGYLLGSLLLPFIGPLLVVIIGASNHGRKGASLLVRTGIAVLVVQMVAVVAAALIAPLFMSLREQEALAAAQQGRAIPSARAVLEEVMAAQRSYHEQHGSYGDLSQLQSAGLLSEDTLDGASAVSLTIGLSEDAQDYTALASDQRGSLSASSAGLRRH